MTMRWLIPLFALTVVAACGRPVEVRSTASAALPIAANLKASAASQQSRFAVQRNLLDGRANELAQQAALARARANDIELDWKFAGDAASPKKLAMFRESDAAILADPLASLAPATTISSKPAPLDLGSLNNVVGGFDRLRAARKPDGKELFAFFVSVNDKLGEIEGEKAPK
jgi:hypothetical protein